MKHKTIKLTEQQFHKLMNEDYPFSYLGKGSTDVNQGSEITANIPDDSVGIDVEQTDTDKTASTLSNNRWWNRSYGGNRYKV